MSGTPRLARLDEADVLMAFIRDHWSKNHVLARSRALMDWQHRNEAAGRYNFIVSGETGDLSAILGFIPASRYDSALATSDTHWLTTWKARPDRAAGLGLKLLLALDRTLPAAWIGTVGLNVATRGIYDALDYATGRMHRFFLVNPDKRDFHLAQRPAGFSQAPGARGTARLTRLTEETLLAQPASSDDIGPAKTPAQFVSRYLRHPFYRYEAWQVESEGASAVLITRACPHEGATALRIVDMLGTPAALAGARTALEELLAACDAEYLDFFCSGLAEEMAQAGLADLPGTSDIVLPGYFEPFERRNVELLYSLKGPKRRLIICKGDADQDRPNLLGAA